MCVQDGDHVPVVDPIPHPPGPFFASTDNPRDYIFIDHVLRAVDAPTRDNILLKPIKDRMETTEQKEIRK